MKKMALPVIGALICLQFTAGCLETGRSGSPVRTAQGKNNSINAKKAQQMAIESSISEKEFVFAEDDAYRNYIDPVVSNIKANGQDSIGLEKLIKSRKWTTLSLYNKIAPKEVFFTPKIKDSTIAWVSSAAIQIDKSTYDSYLKEQQGKLLMTLLMSVMRLETKGILANYATQIQEGVPSDVAAVLEEQGQNQDQVASADVTTDSENTMAEDDDTVAAATANTRKTLPVKGCESQEIPTNCTQQQVDAYETLRGKLLTDEDKKNIELAADYMLQNGRSGKIAEITAKLKELTIIK